MCKTFTGITQLKRDQFACLRSIPEVCFMWQFNNQTYAKVNHLGPSWAKVNHRELTASQQWTNIDVKWQGEQLAFHWEFHDYLVLIKI